MDNKYLPVAALIVSAIGLFAGVISWWLGKFLADKRDSVSYGIKIEHLESRVDDLEDEIRELRRK
jgi:hypothetical protein